MQHIYNLHTHTHAHKVAHDRPMVEESNQLGQRQEETRRLHLGFVIATMSQIYVAPPLVVILPLNVNRKQEIKW